MARTCSWRFAPWPILPVPDSVLVALIAGVSALIGAFVGSIGRPLAEDVAARRAERRAAKDARPDRDLERIAPVGRLLAAQSYEGSAEYAVARRSRAELPTAVAAVDDARLQAAVGAFLAASPETWRSTLTDAQHRVGELILERDHRG